MTLEKEDMYKKYLVTRNEWELYSTIPLSDTMFSVLYYGQNGCDSWSMNNEISKFKQVTHYYVRGLIGHKLFIRSIFNDMKDMNELSGVYNFDPWGREFPYFIETLESGYYKTCKYTKSGLAYGYWVIYDDNVVSSDTFKYKHDYKQDVKSISLIKDKIPRMILTTTTLNGVMVGCLDIIV